MQMVSQIENAIVAALKAAATGFRVDAIESYGGQLDDEVFEWVRRLPAMWAVFSGAEEPTAVSTARNKWRFKGTFTIFCAQRNLGGNKAQRQGDANNPGVYALMQVAKAALLGRDLGLSIKPFVPGAIRPVFSAVINRDAVMAYATTWVTEWIETAIEPPLAPEGWLDFMDLRYFLQPGDDAADAADTIATTA